MAQQDDQTFRVKVGPVENPLTLEVHPAAGDLPPWDNESRLRSVKGRHPRLEAPLKVTGRARYTHDVQLPGMLWAKMIRAMIPAGKIVRIDTGKAEQVKGVKAVWTTDARLVRFAGQDIAAVAAASQEIAEDAARLVEVRYEATPFVTDLEEAMAPNAPLVFAEGQAPAPPGTPRKGNVTGPLPPATAGGARGGSRGDVEKGFAEAHTVHEATYRVQVHTHSVLETHGIVAHWEGDRLTVYASTQGVFMVRAALAETFGLPRNKVRVITEHMGGGFGNKLSPSAVGSAFAIIACRLARKAGAPVKLMLDRHEEQLCTGNAPGVLSTVWLGAKRDGTLTAIHYRASTEGGVGQSARTGAPAGSMYAECPNVLLEEYDVLTNAGPTCALRAPGHPQGAFGLECAMDELAHRLDMDPLELRRRNDTHPFRRAYYDVGAKAIGWERRNRVPGETPGLKKGGDICFAAGGENRYHTIFGDGACNAPHPSNAAMGLLALKASLVFQSGRGTRTVPAEQFFTIPENDPRRENAGESGEILTAISLPAAPGARSAYASVKEKAAFDWPLVSSAVALRVEGGLVREARIVLGAVAPVPRRSAAAEQELIGRRLDEATAGAAAGAAVVSAQPLSENGYKVELLKVLLRRTLRSLAGGEG